MGNGYLNLLNDEKVIKKEANVRLGTGPVCLDELVLTNKAILIVKKNVLGTVKEVQRSPLESISDMKAETAFDGKAQLVFKQNGNLEEITFQEGTTKKVNNWIKAIASEKNTGRTEKIMSLNRVICTNCGEEQECGNADAQICTKCASPFVVADGKKLYQEKIELEAEQAAFAVEPAPEINEPVENKDEMRDTSDVMVEKFQNELLNQILNKKYWRRNALIVFIIFIIMFVKINSVVKTHKKNAENRAAEESGMIHLPEYTSSMAGNSYELVYQELVDAGFTNIQLYPKEDMDTWAAIWGDYVEGEVSTVKVDGSSAGKDEWFNPDVPILIEYHHEKDESKENITEDKSNAEEVVTEGDSSSTNETSQVVVEDKNVLEEIEEQEVKVSSARYHVQSKEYKGLYPDMLSATIYNGSSTDIKSAVVAFAMWDENNLPVEIEGYASLWGSSYIRSVSYGDINLIPGGSYGDDKGFEIETPNVKVKTVKAIVVSWTDFDGNTWKNPYYDAWKEMYYGVKLSQ